MNDEAFNALAKIGYSEEFLQDIREIARELGEEKITVYFYPSLRVNSEKYSIFTELNWCSIYFRENPEIDWNLVCANFNFNEKSIRIDGRSWAFKHKTPKETAFIIRDEWHRKFDVWHRTYPEESEE